MDQKNKKSGSEYKKIRLEKEAEVRKSTQNISRFLVKESNSIASAYDESSDHAPICDSSSASQCVDETNESTSG